MLMPSTLPLGELENPTEFIARHIGISAADEAHMLSVIGEASRRTLIDSVVPRSIARRASSSSASGAAPVGRYEITDTCSGSRWRSSAACRSARWIWKRTVTSLG